MQRMGGTEPVVPGSGRRFGTTQMLECGRPVRSQSAGAGRADVPVATLCVCRQFSEQSALISIQKEARSIVQCTASSVVPSDGNHLRPSSLRNGDRLPSALPLSQCALSCVLARHGSSVLAVL